MDAASNKDVVRRIYEDLVNGRRLDLLEELPPWRATLAVLGLFISQRLRPTEAKLDKIITRSLGEGERVNHEFRGSSDVAVLLGDLIILGTAAVGALQVLAATAASRRRRWLSPVVPSPPRSRRCWSACDFPNRHVPDGCSRENFLHEGNVEDSDSENRQQNEADD
jgi:hypothetical protein